MILSSLAVPMTEGVFGPELLLEVATGEGCYRSDDDRLVGAPPRTPATNAFLVWVGFAVLVVSEGVQAKDIPVVANKLRERLHAARLPVIFSMPTRGTERGVSIEVDVVDDLVSSEDLARAEAYARVQLAWEEDTAVVCVGRETYRFDVSFDEATPGEYRPVLTARR